MTKSVKRRLAAWLASLLMVFSVVFVQPPKAKAFAFVIPVAVWTISEILFAAGITVVIGTQVYDFWMSIVDGYNALYPDDMGILDENTETIYNFDTGQYENKVTVPDSVWEHAKDYASENYNEGENTINVGDDGTNDYLNMKGYPDAPVYDHDAYPYWFVAIGDDDLTLFYTNTMPELRFDSNALSTHGISDRYRLIDGAWVHNWGPGAGVADWYHMPVIGASNHDIIVELSGLFLYETDWYLYAGEVVEYVIYGEPGVIDNGEYDFVNPDTGVRDISVPLNPDPAGDVTIGGTTYAPVIPAEGTQTSGAEVREAEIENTIPIDQTADYDTPVGVPDLALDLFGIFDMLLEKTAYGPLSDSVAQLQNFDISEVDPPVVNINLAEIFNAATNRFGAPASPFPDEESVFIDFGMLNDYEFMGFTILDYVRMIISVDMIWMTFLYVWRKLVPGEVVQ